MEPKKITFLKQQIEALNGENIEVTMDFIRETIYESIEFLAQDPLDVLTENFDRDKERLAKYLNVKFEPTPYGAYRVFPIT